MSKRGLSIDRTPAGTRSRVGHYLELTKPELSLLSVMTTLAGFYVGSRGALDAVLLIHTLLGTALVAGGAGVLNMFLERNLDAKMRRTEKRPLPSGRLRPGEALTFGLTISAAGTLYLLAAVNLLTSLLAAMALASYLFAYTPLKRKTPFSTVVGGIPGAIPPMMGWTAARGEIDFGAWVLFAIPFLWQIPHFLALAWMYRKDYARAGFRMSTVLDPSGRSTSQQIIFYCAVLLLVSTVPTAMGLSGWLYLIGALVLGLAFGFCGVAVARFRSNVVAKRLFLASLIYLPVLLLLLMIDKTPI